MTRVVVTAIDRYGQTVPGANNMVTLSVSGSADFIGQNSIALEDGKTAFYVKTRADETGAVTCRAAGSGIAPATARLSISADPGQPLRQKVLGR
jgi:hypothetical protein